MGLKVKGGKITHFSFINITKMYNDNFSLETLFGFMDILHINKQKNKFKCYLCNMVKQYFFI